MKLGYFAIFLNDIKHSLSLTLISYWSTFTKLHKH